MPARHRQLQAPERPLRPSGATRSSSGSRRCSRHGPDARGLPARRRRVRPPRPAASEPRPRRRRIVPHARSPTEVLPDGEHDRPSAPASPTCRDRRGRARSCAGCRRRALLVEAPRQEPALRLRPVRGRALLVARAGASVEYDARLRATENLIRVVDARDTYTGSHSQSVAILVEAIGQALGFDEASVAQLRLAGAASRPRQDRRPGQILQKPGRLTPPSRARRAGIPDRLRPAPGSRRRPGRQLDPPPPRALGRLRLSARARRRRHPDRLADHPRRGRVRRDDQRAQLPARVPGRGGLEELRAVRGHAVRPGGGGRARAGARPPRRRTAALASRVA